MSYRVHRRTFFSGLLLIASLFFSPLLAHAKQPLRIITVGAPITEIVYALGAGDEIIATDTTSTFPDASAKTKKIGYMRALSAEGLLSLSPTHVLVQEGSGPEHALKQLEAQGINVIRIPEPQSPEGLSLKIKSIATAIGHIPEGNALVKKTAAHFQSLASKQKHSGGLNGEKVMCLIHAGNGGPLAAGEGTVADRLVKLAGGRNALAPMHAYRPLSVEAGIEAAPDMLLVTAAIVKQAGGLDALLAMPQVAQTPAAATHRVAIVPGELLLGMGPRTPEAIQKILAAGS